MKTTLTSFVCLAVLITAHAAAAQDAVQSADVEAVLKDYVEALGGRNAIEKIETRLTRGTVRVGEFDAEFKLYQRTPDHYHMVQVFPFGEMDQGYDGEQGWRTVPGQGRVPVMGGELEDNKFQFNLHQPLVIADTYSATKSEDATLDGRQMHVLEITSHSGGSQQWYFDAETHLLARVDSEVDAGPGGKIQVRTTYDDWKSVDGVLVPHTMRSTFGEVDVRLDFTSVEQNMALSDEDFAPLPQQ